MEQLFDQRLTRRGRGRLGIEIDQPARDIGPFVGDRTGETPKRSLPRAYTTGRMVWHRHRARRDDRQTRGRRQPRCDQRLHGEQQVETAVPLYRQRV